MPIVLNCPCGKRLRIPDASAGGRVRCPGCERALTVPPGSAPAPAPRAPAAPPSKGTPDMVHFACACGAQLRVKAEYAGRLSRCPECGAQSTVPDRDGDSAPARSRVRADRPAPPPPARDDDRPRRRDEDEDDRPRRRDEDDESRPRYDEEDDRGRRPRRKRRRSRGSLLPWVLAGAGLFLFVGVGGAVATWLLFFRSPAHFAYVPADSQGFITFRLADVWNADAFKKGMQQARNLPGGLAGADPAAEMEKVFFLRPEEVERLTVVVRDAEKETTWFVLTTVKAYDQKKLLGKLTSPREVKHEGKTYHVGKAPGKPREDTALHFASSRVLVFADTEKSIKECLTYMAGKRPSGPLSDAIRRADSNHYLVAAFNPGSQAQKIKGLLGPAGSQYAGLLDVQVGTVVVDLGDTISVEAGLRYPSEEQATQAKKTIDDALSTAQQFRETLEGQLNQPGAPPDAKTGLEALRDAFNSLKVAQSGADLTITMAVKSQTFELMNLGGGIAPGPRPGPGPGPGPGPRPIPRPKR